MSNNSCSSSSFSASFTSSATSINSANFTPPSNADTSLSITNTSSNSSTSTSPSSNTSNNSPISSTSVSSSSSSSVTNNTTLTAVSTDESVVTGRRTRRRKTTTLLKFLLISYRWLKETYSKIKDLHDEDVRENKKLRKELSDKVWFPPHENMPAKQEAERIWLEFKAFYEDYKERTEGSPCRVPILNQIYSSTS